MENKTVSLEFNRDEINFLANCLDVYVKQQGLNAVANVNVMAGKLGTAAKALDEAEAPEEEAPVGK